MKAKKTAISLHRRFEQVVGRTNAMKTKRRGGKGQGSFRDILSNKRQEIHDHALPEIIWHIDIRSIDR